MREGRKGFSIMPASVETHLPAGDRPTPRPLRTRLGWSQTCLSTRTREIAGILTCVCLHADRPGLQNFFM